jgi:N-acylglucosamine-6-phosphate 2-epimerase
VLELEAAGAAIIAIDATERLRTGGVNLEKFLHQVRAETNIPILADVDTVEAAVIAEALGCEAVATTLSGYTEKPAPPLPNIGLVEKLVKKVKVPVIAEGGFSRPEHVTQAFAAGAWTVCIGTAITNPFLLTKSFLEAID